MIKRSRGDKIAFNRKTTAATRKVFEGLKCMVKTFCQNFIRKFSLTTGITRQNIRKQRSFNKDEMLPRAWHKEKVPDRNRTHDIPDTKWLF